MPHRVPVTLACWDYDRTAALALRLDRHLPGDACGRAPPVLVRAASLADAERTRRVMGTDFWSYGLTGNEETLSTFLRYSRAQGLISSAPAPESLFAPETLEGYVI